MYERSYGYRYGEATDSSAASIAKRMRADIAQATEEGFLPKRWKYSVRSETFSGGQSIDIRVTDCPDAFQPCAGTRGSAMCPDAWCAARVAIAKDRDPQHARTHDVRTPEAEAAEMTLKRIHDAYNHDGSDIMTDYFDVRYYGQVTFESAESAGWRAKEEARKTERRAVLDQAAKGEVRRVVNYAGRSPVVHDAAEVEGRIRFLCGASARTRALLAFTEKELTCSRCLKRAAREGR